MATVVECVGGAGVGKSLVARALVAELQAWGFPASEAMAPIGPGVAKVRRVARKAALALVEVVRSPAATVDIARAVARSGQRSRRDAVAIALNWVAIRALVRRSRQDPGCAVFDQAALMGLWSTGLRGDASGCRAVLEQPAWSWVLPDAVVRVDASTERTVAQLRARGQQQSRLEALGDADLVVELDRAAGDLASLVGWWRDAGSVGNGRLVAHVSNPGDTRLAEIVPELASELLAFHDTRARPAGADGVGWGTKEGQVAL